MSNKDYKVLVRESQLFEKYYREQKIVPEKEWPVFLEYLKCDLPSTFRIVNASPYSNSIKEFVKEMEKIYLDEDENGQKEPLIKEISWYPNSLAYQITKSRDKLRRSSGILKEFHSKLVPMSDGGSILRQEAVSMLPVLFLDINSTHYVLDMCSAPGSKTSQIIEILQIDNNDDKTYPKGFVIANDLDTRRAHMLIHHTRHLNSPSLIVTTHSADHFPDLYIDRNTEQPTKFFFDRILCDVPCSSDGTLRKNPNLFSKWSVNFSLGLHKLQRNILLRALNLLKPKDGLLVYSTCSFNPLENEAVVASVINSLSLRGIHIEIVDPLEVSAISKEIISKTKFGKGLNYWKVPIPRRKLKKNKRKKCNEMEKEQIIEELKEFYENYDDVPFNSRETIFPSMFPPEDIKIRENLSKCIRVSPHQENTGGFFICIMKIVSNECNERKNQNYSMNIQDDYLPLSENPNKKNIIKMIFSPYGINEFNEEKLLNTLIYRNLRGDFNKACINKERMKNFKMDRLTNIKDGINNSEDLDETKFPRKMWQISESVADFLFSVKSRSPLRVIHAGFPGIEFTRYRKGPIIIEDHQIIDVNYPPIYRFNTAYNSYLYNQHKLPLNNTLRCRELSIKTVLKLFQTIEKPSELSEEKEFHPFRVPKHMLKEDQYPDLNNIFDLPGSIIIRLNLDEFKFKPIFLPAHIGRYHIELLLDKFLRYCLKFHIENIYNKLMIDSN